MRSVEEQQARISAAAVAPRPIRVAIAEAQGLMCAEEVVTERPMPGFDQAAIDGYAVRSVDVAGVGDTGGVQVFADHGDLDGRDVLTLPVMGTIEAGARTLSRLQPRQAVRVQTGARFPPWPMRSCRCGGPMAECLGCGCCAGRRRAPTCGVRATTCSPVMWRCARGRSSAQPRWGCWRRSAVNGCWCTLVRGCR